MLRIKRIKKEYTIYPSTPGYVVDILTESNKVFEAILPKAEVDLSMHLRYMIRNGKLLEADAKKLMEIIESYGDEKYSIGVADGEMYNEDC